MESCNQISHFGVYGVVQSENGILVIKKSRGVYTGLFDLPGGTPEFQESFEETLKREMLEETNLVVKKCTLMFPLLSIKTFVDTALRHVGIIYLVDDFYGELKSDSDGEDSNGSVFIDLNAINEKCCTPFVCEVATKLRR